MKLEEFKKHCEEYISAHSLIASAGDLANLVDGFEAARNFGATQDMSLNQAYAMAAFYFRGIEVGRVEQCETTRSFLRDCSR